MQDYNAVVRHYLHVASLKLQQKTWQDILTDLSFIQVPTSEYKGEQVTLFQKKNFSQ